MYIVMFILDMICFESLVTLKSILSHLFFYWLHFNILVFVKKLCQHHCCLSFDLKPVLILICKYNIYWSVLNDLFSGRNQYFLYKRGGCQTAAAPPAAAAKHKKSKNLPLIIVLT